MMKLLRLPRTASVPLILVAVLFAMMLVLGWSTYLELERQRSSPTDSAQWTIFQTSLEFNRLNTAYGQFRVSPSDQNREEFKKRFDIFFSRISLLDGRSFDAYRDKSYFIQTVRDLSSFVQLLAKIVDRKEFDTLRDDPGIAIAFQETARSVTTFVASAVQTQAMWDAASRDRLKWLLISQLVTSGLVLVAFLYFASAVIRQRNQSVAREAEIRSRKDLLRATVNSSLDGVMIADAKGTIVEINNAAAAMFGFVPSDMEGRDMARLIVPPRLRAAHNEGMSRYAATGKAKVIGRRVEIDAMRCDGTEFPIELSISATGSGSDAKYVAFMRDISERRLQERSLQSAKDRAESASREKAQFLAAISHEMRTPLTGILGALELLSRTRLTESQTTYLQTADRSGHALLSVISDVLDISRIEASRIELDLETLDLDGIVGDVVEIIGKLAADHGNIIHVDIDRTMPAALTGDTARIRQVLLNLATNAAKFTRNGTIAISVTRLMETNGQTEVQFSVHDTGPGISDSDKAKLFRSFSQLSNGVEHPMGGSGLGLAISSRLVDMMKGSIGVESRIGKGSTFWFRLPLATGAEPTLVNDGAMASQLQNSPMAPKTVLVIDDNETVRSIISGQLAAHGHSAETADGALKGLSMLKSAEFDAVILDISMPGMDGFEALKEIRRLPGAAGRTPVIALTAHALAEDRERCLAAGFDQFLTKPVRAADLTRAIVLATSDAAASARAAREADGIADGTALFDLGGLREQFVSVSPADLHRIVDRFGAELDQQLALLKAEGAEMSPHHFRRIVHVLSGSSSMIGARRLAALAGELDAQASQADEPARLVSLDELMTLIAQTRGAVEAAKLELQANDTGHTG